MAETTSDSYIERLALLAKRAVGKTASRGPWLAMTLIESSGSRRQVPETRRGAIFDDMPQLTAQEMHAN